MERTVHPPAALSFSQRHGRRHTSYGRRSALVAACNLTAAKDEPPLRFIFAAGGTGGHVFPAIAIADALKNLHPSSIIQFAGTKHRIEASAVPLAGYRFHAIPAVVALRRPIFSLVNFLLPFKLIISLCVCLHLIAKFRPHLVVGTGGYVSGPLCIAAALSRCPFVIQEQNAYPGITNRVLSRFSAVVFVAFAAAIRYFPSHKCVLCGNPVRSSLQHPVPKSEAVRHFFPDYQSDRKNFHCNHNDDGGSLVLEDPSTHKLIVPQVVLVVGGSLGAQSINEAVNGMVIQMLNEHPERFVIWQTGPKHYNNVINTIDKHQRLLISEFLIRALVSIRFLNDMNLAYSAADIVVARSGAITCSELLISGKPSILITGEEILTRVHLCAAGIICVLRCLGTLYEPLYSWDRANLVPWSTVTPPADDNTWPNVFSLQLAEGTLVLLQAFIMPQLGEVCVSFGWANVAQLSTTMLLADDNTLVNVCNVQLADGISVLLQIPSRYVTDDHQTKNADALVDAGAARVLSDLNLDATKLKCEINGLLGDRASMLRMQKAALKVAVSDAANLIAREIVSLAKCRAS